MEQVYSKKITVFIYVSLTLATIIAFESMRHNDFISLDDEQYVTSNRYVKAGITYKSFIWALTSPGTGNWHPLTWLSHMLDCQLYGLNPLGHHITNLIFHIINTLLLFCLLKAMTGLTWPSAFVAAVFALHPLRVESVAWVSERKDVLSAFFWFLTMMVYHWYTKKPSIKRYSPVVLFFALGLMAKSMLVTLPFVLLLLDYWPLERLRLRTVLEKIPLLVLSAVSGAVTFVVQRSAGAMSASGPSPFSSRISNAFISYSCYLKNMFFPRHLAVLYPFPKTGFSTQQQIVSIAVLVVVSLVAIYTIRRRRYIFVGWFWFLGTMIPVIGLVQVGVQRMADRYTYLPLIGINIIITWGIIDILKRWRFKKWILTVSSAILIFVLIICTRSQVGYWKDSLTLYKHSIKVTKDNYLLHNNCGIVLAKKGLPDKALKHYELSIQIEPKNPNAYYRMGGSYMVLGRVNQAVACWSQSLKLESNNHRALNNLAWVKSAYCDSEWYDPDKAIQLALKACGQSDFAVAAYLDTLAVSFAAAGKFTQAIETAEKAMQLALSDDDNDMVQIMKSRLLLYKAARPYCETPPSPPDDNQP